MIEELTPGVLATSLVLILLCAPVLTALLASTFLWRYRRAVVATMSSHSGSERSLHYPTVAKDGSADTLGPPAGSPGVLYRYACRAGLYDLAGFLAAVLLAAVPLSFAAQHVYPRGMGMAGFALGLWIYAWPLVPAAALILPLSLRLMTGTAMLWLLIYALLALWGSTYTNIPAQHLGGVTMPERSGVTPLTMGMLWLAVNGVPTALCLLCFNRRVRAVAPLVLLLVTLLVGGLWSAWIWASMPFGFGLLVSVAEMLPLHPAIVIGLYLVLALGLLMLVGWALVRAVARAYRHKRLSDRSLALDAIYLAFLGSYGMWLVLGGLAWLICVPLAFGVYKGVLGLAGVLRRPPATTRGLCFLRVFALGRRSQQLMESLARYWRSIGSIQLITGPDVATSLVQPDQFLDYLSGDLQRHFVSDAASLDLAMSGLDRDADPDRRFRINGLFCYEDTWQSVLPALASGSTLLMDLRGFSADNSGCRDELDFIATRVHTSNCLFLLDESTDRGYLQGVLEHALAAAGPGGPNARFGAGDFRQMELSRGDAGIRRLLRVLLPQG